MNTCSRSSNSNVHLLMFSSSCLKVMLEVTLADCEVVVLLVRVAAVLLLLAGAVRPAVSCHANNSHGGVKND